MRRHKKTALRKKLIKGVCIFLVVFLFAPFLARDTREVELRDPSYLLKSSLGHEVHYETHNQHVVSISQVGLILAVEVYHGFCNRLRAYLSAAALAKKAKRELILVWNTDIHANFTMSDIFCDWPATYTTNENKGVLEELLLSPVGVDIYDYLDPSEKNTAIDARTTKHIYIRSSFVIKGIPEITDEDIHEQLLLLKENRAVSSLVERNEVELGSAPYFGAHIRMLSDMKKDIPGISATPYSSPIGLARTNQAVQYRRSCHFSNFIPKINLLSEEYDKFFVASDSQEALEALRARYGNRVVHTPDIISEPCTGIHRRGVYCAQVAFSEFKTLSRASYILTSTWSSASEIVVRLSKSEHSSGCAAVVDKSAKHHFWDSVFV